MPRTFLRAFPAAAISAFIRGGPRVFAGALAVDGEGNLYFADPNNSVIRKRDTAGAVRVVVGVERMATFEPGALPGKIAAPAGLAIRGTNLYITLPNGVAVVTNRP